MTEKKYPEEIYRAGKTDNYVAMPIVRETLENAYDLGLEHGQPGDPLLGWSNLTEAIKAGENIDWDKLDSLEAKCVHPELGTLTHRLERDEICFSDNPGGWYMDNSPGVWKQAIYDSWMGFRGWSLWIKGDMPLVKQTADQLEPGTCFRGSYILARNPYVYTRSQLVQVHGETKVVCFNRQITSVIAVCDPANVEVLEVYGVGNFPTPKEDA